ncbi:DNA adenine methylase [Roseibacillus ishigakijimensis]|uniref:site-specific DNA-methyltransferase (adenine-specific) n=1 Tax=Roseibacillus ishigakijimensis TaxID=454146 RepID=A0A934RQE1_9BACT|nr:Dam family site-specific DNA-(adenine-N6)-methyltransferase [Roseibacillus ishigakijimensis]MBK1833548.1 Dam family site-specific DNA-(adenine-N6)-methyltransferase [Roseibacillus ishigakijimensis]
MTPTTPPLKWAGGKRWLLPELLPLWQPHSTRRLVEPFCGGLAVALGLRPRAALLSDANPHLINFYRQLQRGLALSITTSNEASLYYAHRDRFNALIRAGQADTAEAAQLFYYLNRTGFNGLCRFNRSGLFNVPFGRHKTINYRADFAELTALFAPWAFSQGDFTHLEIAPDDFLYVDPPYDVEFTQYSAGGFTWDDQIRLVQWLANHPGPVVLSNQLTPRIEALYREAGYDLRPLAAPRRISRTGDRTPAQEVLATRNLEL